MYMFKSRLGLLNFILLQWFFVRLTKMTPALATAGAKRPLAQWTDQPVYFFIGPVLPLSGWWTSYVFLPGAKRSV